METKDKLNFAWKFLFLAVFTYGVVSLTCCSKDCNTTSCCKTDTQCTKTVSDDKTCDKDKK